MARAALSRGLNPPVPGPWQRALVVGAHEHTQRTRSIWLKPDRPVAHLPGQHYDLRLTAPDGYQAQRSYSVASSPVEPRTIELTVDRLDDGEVSPYLTDELQIGDGLEIRGPIGLYFAWRGEAPLLLIGGGSGVVPLMAMLRHRRLVAPEIPTALIYSVRSPADVLFAQDLGLETTLTYTRTWPSDWTGATGRLSGEILAHAAFASGPAFVCGSSGFVEGAASLLLEAGYEAQRILTERFGPTGA